MPKTESQLVSIAVDDVHDHPNNPRVIFRDDVIDGIAANLNGEYPQHHAITVRADGDGYEVISGHHRIRAARKAGLSNVWAFVRDIDDDAAFMELVTSNNQGELAPLEIGMHALSAVQLEQGKEGKGLAAYAKAIGRSKGKISELRQAAEVFVTCSDMGTSLIDKAYHLGHIHPCGRALWPLLVRTMLDKGWSAADTEATCKKVREFNVPPTWAELFLPLHKVVERFLSDEFSPLTVQRLIVTVECGETRLLLLGGKEVEQFHAWLAENAGRASWDERKVNAYVQEREAAAKAADESIEACWKLGDWREHVSALENGSVSLVLTDPPYGIEYRSNHRKEKHDRIAGDASLSEVRDFLAAVVEKLADDAHVLVFFDFRFVSELLTIAEVNGYEVRGQLVWVKNNTGMGDLDGTFAPKCELIMHLVRGKPTLFERTANVLEFDRVATDRHPTEKPEDLCRQLIESTTATGQLVLDPFGGVATVAAAALSIGRRTFGCELSEDYYKAGRERLHENGKRTS